MLVQDGFLYLVVTRHKITVHKEHAHSVLQRGLVRQIRFRCSESTASVFAKGRVENDRGGGGWEEGLSHCNAGANFWSCVFELMARKGSI
jgi:hypothetical protein